MRDGTAESFAIPVRSTMRPMSIIPNSRKTTFQSTPLSSE